jgi:hypothetical protein
MGGDAHFTESVYDQKTAQASFRLKTKVWIPKKRPSTEHYKNFLTVISTSGPLRQASHRRRGLWLAFCAMTLNGWRGNIETAKKSPSIQELE